MRYLVLIGAFILASCTTTTDQKTADISKVNLNSPYVIGSYITYSEICAQFRGDGADRLKIRALMEAYGDNTSFKKGYERNRDFFGADYVNGLDHCGKAREVVNVAYDRLQSGNSAVSVSKPKPDNMKPYVLSVAWENLVDGTVAHPVMIDQKGHVGQIVPKTRVAGKICGGSFKFVDNKHGNWVVNCKDGTAANGTMTAKGPNNGSTGTGVDMEGNKITFDLTPTSAVN